MYDPIICQIVDRCHVGQPFREAIRYTISRLQQGKRTFKAYPRNTRREFIRQCIGRHRDNYAVYVMVMGGRPNRRRE